MSGGSGSRCAAGFAASTAVTSFLCCQLQELQFELNKALTQDMVEHQEVYLTKDLTTVVRMEFLLEHRPEAFNDTL